MKKKIVSMAMVFAMIAALAIGGTLAYFTDTDDAINTFTVGSVEIRLNEDQRKVDEEGNKLNTLETFEDAKKLLPLVGSAQSDDKTTVENKYDGVEAEWQVPNAANWVDKIVSVSNTSTEAAYVRVLMAFPTKMDAATASEMMMHWNIDRNMPDGKFWTYKDTGLKVNIGAEMEGNAEYNDYNVYCMTYQPILEKGKTTEWPAINGVYIDSRVDAEQWNDGSITYTLGDKNAYFVKNDGPKLYVLAQAVQAAGFANAEAALEAGFPDLDANAQTWFNAIQD